MRKKILVVGQTPPPFGGQAIMIKAMLEGEYSEAQLFHVRMCFSREMDEMGRFAFLKLVELVKVIMKIYWFRIIHNIRILYYPPSSPEKLPVYRDIAILCTTRWMFRKTIFHFHATGVGQLYAGLAWPLKLLFRWAYFKPDVAIRLSEFNPDDGSALHAAQQCLVPNGIADEYPGEQDQPVQKSAICTVLFVGLLRESKGILVLVDAIRVLADKGLPVRAVLVGKFESPEFEREVLSRVEEFGLTGRFEFKGVLTGTAKNQQYLNADIFCFPSFFESFGLVVAEAMQFQLPVVVSTGQGLQSLVVDGVTGFITPIDDARDTAGKIERLLLDPELRHRMGSMGRQRFLEEYSLEKFHDRMNDCFSLVG